MPSGYKARISGRCAAWNVRQTGAPIWRTFGPLFFSVFANLATLPLQGAGEVLAEPVPSDVIVLARVGQVLQKVRRVAHHEQEDVSASGLRAAGQLSELGRSDEPADRVDDLGGQEAATAPARS